MRVLRTVNILRGLLCARNCAWRTLYMNVIMYRYCTLYMHTHTCTHRYGHAVTMTSLWGVFGTRCVPSCWSNPAGEGDGVRMVRPTGLSVSASLKWSGLFLVSMCPSKVDVSAGCRHPPKLAFHFGWHSNPSSIDFMAGEDPIFVRTFLQ